MANKKEVEERAMVRCRGVQIVTKLIEYEREERGATTDDDRDDVFS